MREELDALIGVGWGECNPKRKGYRNGFYSRDLVTSSGGILGQGVTLLVIFAETRKGAQSAISLNVVPTLLGV